MPVPMPQPEINLTLAANEVDIILSILQQHPYSQLPAVIAKVHTQATEQLQMVAQRGNGEDRDEVRRHPM